MDKKIIFVLLFVMTILIIATALSKSIEDKNWLYPGFSQYSNNFYHKQYQISAKNAANLEIKWAWEIPRRSPPVMDKEGNHIELGVELLKKYNLPSTVIDCVAEHHEDKPFSSVESMLVYISDAISGSRPGARYEDIEGYIKRLQDLEQIAKSNQGVKEAFAFQAGRELRVIVEPDKIDDAQAVTLSHNLKEEIEKKLTYPGNIRVTVIREMRAVDIAK